VERGAQYKKTNKQKIVLLPAAEECVKCSIVEEVVSEQLHYARILRENFKLHPNLP